MSKYILISFFFLIACKRSSVEMVTESKPIKSNVLEGLSVQIDTVLVDLGEEFINFSLPLITGLSEDVNFFYVLNYQSMQIKKIDLDLPALKETFFLEREGPNSPGFTFQFQPIGNNSFFFPAFQRPSIVHQSGKKLRSWNLNVEQIINGTNADESSVTNRIIYDPKRVQLYSLPANFTSREYYFAVLDSAGAPKQLLELPEFNFAHQFTIQVVGKEGAGLKIEWPFLQQFDDKVIISFSVGNGIYVYDLNTDSLSYREFPLKLVPMRKEGEVKNQVHSQKEYEQELKKLSSKINYQSFVWDKTAEHYYRFASRTINPDLEYPKEEVYLMVFSKDLTLIGETLLEGFSTVPNGGFFKNGKFWTRVELGDDLGFAVVTFIE